MVSRWVRVKYSLLAFLVGISFSGALVTMTAKPNKPKDIVEDFLWGCLPSLIFALPGWLLALPIILKVTNILGGRFWLLLGLGTAIGPVVILGLDTFSWLSGGGKQAFGDLGLVFYLIGAAVAGLVSGIYLLLLRNTSKTPPGSDAEMIDTL